MSTFNQPFYLNSSYILLEVPQAGSQPDPVNSSVAMLSILNVSNPFYFRVYCVLPWNHQERRGR